MDGYKYIFDDAENEYKKVGDKLDNFRFSRNIYGFCINGCEIDNQALNYAKSINNDLCNRFLDQPKGIIGYKGHENEYTKIDDLDSKHILQLTYLFDKIGLSLNNIVEIGGGFGNMYRLCNNIVKYNSWDIIDLPHMLKLQKYYLIHETKDISNINFINCYDIICYKNKIELLIGIHSISEFSWDIFLNYFNNVILKSKYFYLGYNKNCPSPELIQYKLNHILNNGFNKVDSFDYTEHPCGANVSYTLFINKSF